MYSCCIPDVLLSQADPHSVLRSHPTPSPSSHCAGATMPTSTTTLPRTGAANTITLSWQVSDSTLPLTFRLIDRRNGNPIFGSTILQWYTGAYTVRIGATSGSTIFSETNFRCGATTAATTSQGALSNCKTCVGVSSTSLARCILHLHIEPACVLE